MAQHLMEAEVGEHAGASRGERAPDRRAAQRNGYRWREWDTRVGTIELAIPKVRPGPSYFPSLVEARRRAERALCAVVAQAYVEGVSTRKVEDVAAQMITKRHSNRRCHGASGPLACSTVTRSCLASSRYLWTSSSK